MIMNYYQAGPFRAGVVRFGWMQLPDSPDRFLWAYQVPPSEASDHQTLLTTNDWMRIYTPGWYWLVGSGPDDLILTPAYPLEKAIARFAWEENAIIRAQQEYDDQVRASQA